MTFALSLFGTRPGAGKRGAETFFEKSKRCPRLERQIAGVEILLPLWRVDEGHRGIARERVIDLRAVVGVTVVYGDLNVAGIDENDRRHLLAAVVPDFGKGPPSA